MSTRSGPRAHWVEWVRGLSIPFEWQDEVIRAAITLQLCYCEETGAIVAAAHDLDPGARRLRTQLGLSLLLAARRLFRDPRPEPARGDGHDGGLPRIPDESGGGSGSRRRSSTCLRDRAGERPDRAFRADVGRLSGYGAGSRRQPGLRTHPERRLRLGRAGGDAVLLRCTAAATGRRASLQAAGGRGRARGSGLGQARRGTVGAPDSCERPYLLRRDVLGRL